MQTNATMDDFELTVATFVSWISSAAMIFGGVFPYIPQYREIKKTGNADGFSLYVCLALLVANILRIIFWFGKPFELPLLFQSILMNIAMLTMVQLCVGVKLKSEIIKKKERVFTDFNSNHFWDWTDFQSYIECILVFSILCGICMFIFGNVSVFVETIGFLAVFVEAMLGVPQFLRNCQQSSTKGMSQTMVLMWTCGDIFKTIYFIMRKAPIQFTICGCLQIGVDLAIWIQIMMYALPPSRSI